MVFRKKVLYYENVLALKSEELSVRVLIRSFYLLYRVNWKFSFHSQQKMKADDDEEDSIDRVEHENEEDDGEDDLIDSVEYEDEEDLTDRVEHEDKEDLTD